MDNDYQFVTHWRVEANEATREEVFDLLADAEGLPRWWPSVYLAVQVLAPGEPNGVGRVVDLHTRGLLPYTLRWQFRVTEVRRPERMALEAWGDLVGTGIWTLRDEAGATAITYDWRVRAEKPLLRLLSPLLKPLFAANHRWAMARGDESLHRELARRRQ